MIVSRLSRRRPSRHPHAFAASSGGAALPGIEVDAEPGVGKAVGMGRPVFFPQQHPGYPGAPQFSIHHYPIRNRAIRIRHRRRRRNRRSSRAPSSRPDQTRLISDKNAAHHRAKRAPISSEIPARYYPKHADKRWIDRFSRPGRTRFCRSIFFRREDTMGLLEFLWALRESLIEYGHLRWMDCQSSGRTKPPRMRRGFKKSIIV